MTVKFMFCIFQIECSSIIDYAQKIVDDNNFGDGK